MSQGKWIEQYFIILVILGLFVLVVLPLATPVALGFLIALVFNSFNAKLNQWLGNRRYLSATITTLFFTTCVVLPLALIGIGAAKEASGLIKSISAWAKDFNLEESLDFLKTNRKIYNFIPFSEGELKGKLQELLAMAGTAVAQFLASFATALPVLGLAVIMFVLSFFYALVDGQSLATYIARCLPFEKVEISDLYTTTQQICYGVVVGSVVAGITQGLVIGVAYWALGVPGALLFAAVTAVLSFVPILGSGPTGLGGAIYLLAHGQKGGALIMLGALLLASVSDNIVKPIALKGAVELHPLLGLVSALGGLAVFGFVGLFLGPLFAGFMIVILDMLQRRNSSSQISGL